MGGGESYIGSDRESEKGRGETEKREIGRKWE
jgi:hypothetical protein